MTITNTDTERVERAAFETWAKREGYRTDLVPDGVGIDGLPVYDDACTHAAWWAWQAARPHLRPEVMAFADAMESKLRDNDDKGGWEGCAPHWLMMRVIGEAAELLAELVPDTRAAAQFYAASRMLYAACDELDQFGAYLKTTGDAARVLGEAVDVANFAMMLADVIAGSNATGTGPRQAQLAEGPR